jgi:hypothetical protein
VSCCRWSRSSPTTAARSARSASEPSSSCTPNWPDPGEDTPGQNGPRERGFGTLKYERLFIDEIDDAVMLAKHAEEYRLEYDVKSIPCLSVRNKVA